MMVGLYAWVLPLCILQQLVHVTLASISHEAKLGLYQHLDNDIYTLSLVANTGHLLNLTTLEFDVDTRYKRRREAVDDASPSSHRPVPAQDEFPRPPRFPPPPPAWQNDDNALLREAIFSNMHDRERSVSPSTPGIEDCPKDDPNTHPTRPNKGRGSRGKGRVGARGPRGRRGRTGKPGAQGPQGSPGTSGPLGRPGPEGSAGSPGTSGVDGMRGIPGPVGPSGERGRPGLRGRVGVPGTPGPSGRDGVPGLVMFADDSTMQGVALEGLVAYRSDNKQLYFRDHNSWRIIKTTQCGDGIIDRQTGEECDDGNDNVRDSCVGCRLAQCGDGFMHIGFEECDGRDFGGKSCSSFKNGLRGMLHCTTKCTISYRRCNSQGR